MKKLIVATIGALSLAGAGHATIITYDVLANFEDGSNLSGSFKLDDAGPAVVQFSDIDIAVTGPNYLTQLTGLIFDPSVTSGTNPVQIAFGTSDFSVSVAFTLTATYDGYVISDIASQNFASGLLSVAGDTSSQSAMLRGVILKETSAIPEPATWLTMIGGFGLIGGAMRRKTATVRFA